MNPKDILTQAITNEILQQNFETFKKGILSVFIDEEGNIITSTESKTSKEILWSGCATLLSDIEKPNSTAEVIDSITSEIHTFYTHSGIAGIMYESYDLSLWPSKWFVVDINKKIKCFYNLKDAVIYIRSQYPEWGASGDIDIDPKDILKVLKECAAETITEDILYRFWTAHSGIDWFGIYTNKRGKLTARIKNSIRTTTRTGNEPIFYTSSVGTSGIDKEYFTEGLVTGRNEYGFYITKDGRKLTKTELLYEVAKNKDNTKLIEDMVDKLAKDIYIVCYHAQKNNIVGIAHKGSLGRLLVIEQKGKRKTKTIRLFTSPKETISYIQTHYPQWNSFEDNL